MKTLHGTRSETPVPGMLFSQMEPPPELEDEFHTWYDAEHIPDRLAIDGFAAAVRYRVLDGEPRYLAVYELSDLDALATPAYQALKREPSERTARMLAAVHGFTRFTCELVADDGADDAGRTHRYLSAVAFTVPAEDEAAYDDWYDSEHTPMLLEAEDWLRVRRYRVLSGDGGPWTHFALHELASLEVLDGPARAAARSAPKRVALADRPWFGASGRWLYERITW